MDNEILNKAIKLSETIDLLIKKSAELDLKDKSNLQIILNINSHAIGEIGDRVLFEKEEEVIANAVVEGIGIILLAYKKATRMVEERFGNLKT